jgi:hypothetical protein
MICNIMISLCLSSNGQGALCLHVLLFGHMSVLWKRKKKKDCKLLEEKNYVFNFFLYLNSAKDLCVCVCVCVCCWEGIWSKTLLMLAMCSATELQPTPSAKQFCILQQWQKKRKGSADRGGESHDSPE